MKKIIIIIFTIIIVIVGFLFLNRNKIEKKANNMKEEKLQKNNYVSYNGNLKIKDNKLVNSHNDVMILKGMSSHGMQWYSEFLNDSNMKILKNDWSSNLIRIAMYTAEGGYIENDTIKDKVYNAIELAIANDIYVIVDWHILSDNNPNIYKEEAVAFFKELSRKYKNTPNIIYEICNEPNGNVSWDNDIKPYAEEIINVIRSNSNNIIIVGTPSWSQDVDIVAINPINEENIMYALHFYSGTHKDELRKKAQKALEKIPLFVSEWGVGEASGNGGLFLEEAKVWLDFMKKNDLSWANWSLSNKNETTALLLPSSSNIISDEYLSDSGKFIKEEMIKY